MKVPFTWRPTGWFMVGWSADVLEGKAVPLHYFGQDMVAYRSEDGELHVLEAHCKHLGANLAYRGKVNGDCIECPYHGWGWGPDGSNRYIPYEDRPNRSKSLRVWPVQEQHECIFLWHDPEGGAPRWPLPNVFDFAEDIPGGESDYYRAYPELSVKYEGEPVHPQITLENAPDSVHFRYVHGATVDPVLLDWNIDGPFYKTQAGWPVPTKDGDVRMARVIRNVSCGVGGSLSLFEGSIHYRLAFFTTPVDDEKSDMFYSIWWPREQGDENRIAPTAIQERAKKEFLQTLADDLVIWRHQVYVEKPSLAQQDAAPYGALRKWSQQFYEVD
jgi:3-ketosteroid 9alpha-monooxygenase subunit A